MGRGAPGVEREQSAGDQVAGRAGARQREQGSQFFFRDRVGQHVAAGSASISACHILANPVSDRRPRPCSNRRRLAQAESDLAASPALLFPDHPTPDRGHGVVGELDQVEVINDQAGVAQQQLTMVIQRPDRGGVDGGGVDRHEPDVLTKLGSLFGEPVDHRLAGAAGDLPEQALIAGQVHEPGVVWIDPPPPPSRRLSPASHRNGRLVTDPAGLPRRVSSIPNIVVGSTTASSAAACSTNRARAVGHDPERGDVLRDDSPARCGRQDRAGARSRLVRRRSRSGC